MSCNFYDTQTEALPTYASKVKTKGRATKEPKATELQADWFFNPTEPTKGPKATELQADWFKLFNQTEPMKASDEGAEGDRVARRPVQSG